MRGIHATPKTFAVQGDVRKQQQVCICERVQINSWVKK